MHFNPLSANPAKWSNTLIRGVFHQRCSVRKGALRNFAKFTGKHLCKSLFFKVAGVVKLKLDFMEWFFYNLVILIKLYKTRYLNLDKALLFPRNQAIYLKNRKLWRASTTTKFNIFCWNFAHVSYLTMFSKECWGFFSFCLDLELLIKM